LHVQQFFREWHAIDDRSTQLPLPLSNFGDPIAVTQAIKAALLKAPLAPQVIAGWLVPPHMAA